MPITRVLDEKGRTLHDCADAGCQVSWDGFALVDQADVPNPLFGQVGQPATIAVAAGQPMPNAPKIDAATWKSLDAKTVQRIPAPTV